VIWQRRSGKSFARLRDLRGGVTNGAGVPTISSWAFFVPRNLTGIQQKGVAVRRHSYPQLHSYREARDGHMRLGLNSRCPSAHSSIEQAAEQRPMNPWQMDLMRALSHSQRPRRSHRTGGAAERFSAPVFGDRGPLGTGRFDSFSHHRAPAVCSALEQRQSSAETQRGSAYDHIRPARHLSNPSTQRWDAGWLGSAVSRGAQLVPE
jgi:hypothetical protein